MKLEFFENPGCKNSTRQKKLLQAAKIELEVHDLLNCPLDAKQLSRYFKGKPLPLWFNRSAPAIKKGDIDPETISAKNALAAMLEDRLLIKRPLMIWGKKHLSGFDPVTLERLLGLNAGALASDQNLNLCHQASGHDCESPSRVAR